MSFGQHQSFYLRERWLSKGLKELNIKREFFSDKENFEKIGLGKNMVSSLRFWMGATNVISEKDKEISITEIGNLLYKYDKFIKNSFSKLLLHYKLATNDDHNNKYCSTVIYWLFNEFNETTFNKEIISDQFYRWVDKNIKRGITKKSLDKDLNMALQLYTLQNITTDPEEVAVSTLSGLQILKRDDKKFIKSEINEAELSAEIIMIYLIDYFDKTGIRNISIDEILKSRMSIGKILNLSRSSLINKLDELANEKNIKYRISFTRTNNLDTISISEGLKTIDYIKYVYERMYK